MKKALVLLFDKTEEIEAIAPIDILRRARANVTTAAIGDSQKIYGRSGVPIEADTLLGRLKNDDEFDAIVLPGGPGIADIIDDCLLLDFIKVQNKNKRLMCAICAAPTVFQNAGIIGNKACTSHPSVAESLPTRDDSASVVCDGNLITSKGAGTAVEFGLAIVEKLFDKQKSLEISKSICFMQ